MQGPTFSLKSKSESAKSTVYPGYIIATGRCEAYYP